MYRNPDIKMCNSERTLLYNPFLGTHISFMDEVSNRSGLLTSEVLTDVNLYFQPVQYPILATVYLILRIIIIFIGEYVQVKALNLFKRESCIVNDVLTLVSYVQMGYWPLFVLFETSTDFIYPLREVIGTWYCVVGFFIITYGMTHIVFHSFVVGLMRYTFVVHNKRVANFGKERAKRFFLVMSFIVPAVATIWRFLGRLEVSTISSLNKCNGIHHMSFMIENRLGSTAKNNFCFLEEYEEDEVNKPLAVMKRTMCILSSVLYLIMGFNFVEGIFYWRTLKYSEK